MQDDDFLAISIYDNNGNVRIMPAKEWSMGSGSYTHALTIILNKKTTDIELIKTKEEFVLNIANNYHKISTKNYTGDMDKYTFNDLLNSDFTVINGERVNAPIVNEFPIRFECKLLEIKENEETYVIISKIKNRNINIVNS